MTALIVSFSQDGLLIPGLLYFIGIGFLLIFCKVIEIVLFFETRFDYVVLAGLELTLGSNSEFYLPLAFECWD